MKVFMNANPITCQPIAPANTSNPDLLITMTIPLFVRVLELVREDVKSDINLHIMLEKIIELAYDNILTMSSYEEIAKMNPVTPA